jgi:hypothetical protein
MVDLLPIKAFATLLMEVFASKVVTIISVELNPDLAPSRVYPIVTRIFIASLATLMLNVD